MTATTPTSILADAFGRVHEEIPQLLGGLDPDALTWRPDPDANSIGWLIWHLSRVQDDHVAGVGGVEQVYPSQGFVDRFALPYPASAVGYGQTSAEVGAFSVDGPDLLVAYHDAVHAMTLEVINSLVDEGYGRIVDERWDPPVTAAVRLVSVVNDITQHLGQAAYVLGMYRRR